MKMNVISIFCGGRHRFGRKKIPLSHLYPNTQNEIYVYQKLSTLKKDFSPVSLSQARERGTKSGKEVRKFSLSAKLHKTSQTRRSKPSQEEKSPEVDKHKRLSNSLRAPWIYIVYILFVLKYTSVFCLTPVIITAKLAEVQNYLRSKLSRGK